MVGFQRMALSIKMGQANDMNGICVNGAEELHVVEFPHDGVKAYFITAQEHGQALGK